MRQHGEPHFYQANRVCVVKITPGAVHKITSCVQRKEPHKYPDAVLLELINLNSNVLGGHTVHYSRMQHVL